MEKLLTGLNVGSGDLAIGTEVDTDKFTLKKRTINIVSAEHREHCWLNVGYTFKASAS